MASTPKQLTWAGKTWVGGFLSALAGASGFALWLAAARRHRLVLRDDEVSILSTPALAVCAGVLLTAVAFWLLRRRRTSPSAQKDWGEGWLGREREASSDGGRRRGGRLLPRPRGVMYGVVTGSVLAALGFGLWLNCGFGGPERAHVSTITATRVWVSMRGAERSHILRVPDWRGGGAHVSLYVSGEFYETRRTGEQVTVTTKEGLLGYECVVRVE